MPDNGKSGTVPEGWNGWQALLMTSNEPRFIATLIIYPVYMYVYTRPSMAAELNEDDAGVDILNT